ncbi:Biogenesis of lysosome-related organelles complex 1 subunit KXD1, partial [Bienertia sinuspersici]
MSYRSKRTYLAAGGDAPIQENKENMQPSKPSMEPSQSGNKWGPFYPPTLRTSQPFGYLSEPIKPSMAAKNITTFTLPSSKVSESTKSQSPSLQQKPKASQQQQAPTPLTPVQSGQQQKEVGQQQQHTLVALQRQQQSVGQGQKQLHMSVASQQHQKTIALQQQQKTLAQQSNAVTNSSVPQQRQTTSSDPQQDKQAKFPPLKRTQPLAMSPIGSKPPSEKRVANATMGATKPAVISRTPPTLIETTTLNKIPNGNLVTDEPIQPLHHPFMHMNEDTLHMERSPPSIHALSESRLERDLEDSSSESEDFNQGGDRDVCATKAISSRPRRRIIVPDWPEHVKFDEKEEAIAFDVDGKRHLVKGPVQPRDVWNDRGLRYYVQFNDFNQPLRKGGSILVSFLGDVAKRETFCPVGVSSWHKIKKKMKADIVILVRKHFVIPDGELFDKAILRRTSKYWKNYRYFLRENYFDPISRTDDQNYDNRPDGNFRNYLNSEKMLEHHLDMLTSVVLQALLIEELNLEKEKGKFSELDFYKSVYTKKDGSFKEGTLSQQFLEDANNKVKECLASSSSKSRVDIENEVFDDLMYNGEQSDIFGVQGLLRKKGSSYVNHSAIEMENLKAEFSAKNQALESKFDDTAQSFKAIASHLAQVLKEVRNGNASAHLLDGADSAIKLIDTQ